MIKFFNSKINKKTGFTLVEVLVAIFIFSLSVVTFVSVLNQGIRGADNAKKKIEAAYLAQEGIEYFRSMRDTSMQYSSDPKEGWIRFISKLEEQGKCNGDPGCYFIDSNLFDLGTNMPIMNIQVAPCDGNCPELLYDESKSFYEYSKGSSTGFIRKMSETRLNDNEIKIVSEVTWRQGISRGSITFSENLDSWIE